MTKVKFPHNGSKSANTTRTMVVVASLVVLAVVGVALYAVQPVTTITTTIPEAPQLRSSSQTVSKETVLAASSKQGPGTHRYEMILSRLKGNPLLDVDNREDSTTLTGKKVILETYDHWAPIGVAHFAQLVAHEFYNQCRFFRVVDNFVVQFGINGDPQVQRKWRHDVLKDDPVVETNAYGTVTYATSGADSRTVQLFINTNKQGNGRLDGMGFAPIGRIIEGMEWVERINNEYHEKPNQGKIQNKGNQYLDEEFPRLSYIESLRSLDDAPSAA